MAYTFDENIVSDLHKDARGYRPREGFWAEWNSSTDFDRQAIWDGLCRELTATLAEDRAREAQALEDFRAQIHANRRLGAETDRQAIKWIFHAEKLDRYDLAYGADYVAFHFGMSYTNPYRALIQQCCDQALATVQAESAA